MVKPAELHFTRLALSGPFEVTPGETQCRRLLTLSRVPGLCIVMLVEAAATFDLTKNPFNFGHFGLSRCRLIFDGRPYPYTEEEAAVRLDVGTRLEVPIVFRS
ncbi:MAG: hypothetical protein GY737_17125 [Desulfobacteraceae bacterium]|nr:hypothetical protein [Desulfobacteraceae bacterium]